MSESKLLEKRKKVLNKLADHRRWYDIKNQTGDTAVIRIYDEIGWFGITAEDFVSDLDEITAPEIVVAINCPGGDVFDGIAMYNALRTHPAKVTTRVDSLAASAASVIVQAGDERVMLSAAQMMIHEAWGVSVGTADEMREFADLLDMQTSVIAGIYARRSGKDVEHFQGLMDAGTWLTDDEAVVQGLADEVSEPNSKNAPAASVPKGKTLNDEITESIEVVSGTLKSAEWVAAHRAEFGEGLSQVNASSLEELAQATERLKAVLKGNSADGEPSPNTSDQDGEPSQGAPPDDELQSLKALIDAAAL